MTASEILDDILARCIDAGASDVHVSPGGPPHLRIHGDLLPIADHPAVTTGWITMLATHLLDRHARVSAAEAEALGSVDGALSAGYDGTRFRFNVFRRQGEWAIALRRLESRFRPLDELGLPGSLHQFCAHRDGLVIVCGPTGAGKSTTLATLLDHINATRSGHIITIEDPVEYLHASRKCIVNQRQVGWDTPGFNDALVASLRQDPDIVLVGEIRDLDTIRTAITAAETGHLVFTTLHAGDCAGAIERLISVFPADEQDGMRRQLALVLRGVVAQHLLAAADRAGPAGRIACCEILVNTPAVANLIATGKTQQLYSAMETGTAQGMQTLEQDLARLRVMNKISELTAVAMARNAPVLRERMANLRKHAAGGGHE